MAPAALRHEVVDFCDARGGEEREGLAADRTAQEVNAAKEGG